MPQKTPSGPPTPSEVAAMLAEVLDVRSLNTNVIFAVMGQLYGGAADWEGTHGLDTRAALGWKLAPFADDQMISTAVRLTEYHLNGLGWAWTLHSQTRPEHGYVAHLRKGLEVSTLPQKHRYASYALIMALIYAVGIEREAQLAKVQSKAR